jgi:stage III sporulation protein AG
MITFENIGEQVMAENKSSSSSEYVIISGGDIDEGIKLTEIFPTVRGASIVCTNGNDAVVKEKITSLVSSALGIPTNRITVAG